MTFQINARGREGHRMEGSLLKMERKATLYEGIGGYQTEAETDDIIPLSVTKKYKMRRWTDIPS